jgi:hypothetical protein
MEPSVLVEDLKKRRTVDQAVSFNLYNTGIRVLNPYTTGLVARL